MSYAIQDRLSLDILFDGKSLPFSQTFLLGYLHMSNARRLKVPYFSLAVTDNQHWLVANGLLGDGVKITVKLRVGPDASAQTQTYNFTMTYFSPAPVEGSSSYVIEGVLDVPRYLAGTSNKSVTGTSTVALQAIADACGMKADLVATNDSQTWLPSNRKFCDFAGYVAEHGYTKEDGCLRLAVDFQGTLIYSDITAMAQPKAVFGLKDTVTPNVITATSFRPVVSSGGSNVLTGYSASTVEQTLVKPDTHVKQESINTVINESGTLTVSATDKAKVKDGSVRYAPVDPGNVHDKFVRAKHQNLRVANLFSSSLELTTPQPTNLRPLDTVSVSADLLRGDAKSSTDASAYAGTYRIIDRIIYVVPGHYTEKFVLARRTVGIATANSVLTGASSHAPLQSVFIPKVPSLLDIPDFIPAGLEARLTVFASQVSSALGDTTSRLTSAVTGAAGAMQDVLSNITTKISSVNAVLTSAKNSGVAGIAAHMLTKPLPADPTFAAWATTLNDLVTAAKALQDSSLLSEVPNLTKTANRADAMASVAKAVNDAATVVSIASATTGVATQLNTAMLKISKIANTAAAAASAMSGAADLTNAKAALASGTAAITGPLTTQANTLLSDASSWTAQTNAHKAAMKAAIDAAASY